jgi:hypothetical protein
MSTRTGIVFVGALLLAACILPAGGCRELKYHDIYMSAALGAAIGAVVGHQSDECAAGAGIGAAAFAVGELLHQVDNLPRRDLERAADEVARGNVLLDLSHSE